MSYTLKLKGEPSLPGLALPGAFQSLDSRLDSIVQLCAAKGSSEAQLVGIVTVCEELQQLLKCAFIENGMLASRIEILTRYHMETLKKMEKKINYVETENKITRKHLKTLRKKLSAQQVLQKKRGGEWWNMAVRTSDYDSFVTLSTAGGNPDLEFMLRVNQLMIDFVSDSNMTELVLPPMGMEERQEVSKLASIYKLRCRYGKSVQIASSTLLKARQACIPAPGEVDAILNNFTRTHIQRKTTEEVVTEDKSQVGNTRDLATSTRDERMKPPSITLPSTMLTPLSTLPSPTIDISSFRQSSHSPPSSGLATPTEGPIRFLKQRDSTEMSGGHASSSSSPAPVEKKSSSVSTQSGDPLSTGSAGARPELRVLHPRQEHRKGKEVAREMSTLHPQPVSVGKIPMTGVSSAAPSLTGLATVHSKLPRRTPPPVPHPHPSPPSPHIPIGIVLTPTSTVAAATRSTGSGMLVQPQIRGTGTTHSTVVASPLKCHPQSSTAVEQQQPRILRKEREREREDGKKKEKEGEEGLKDEGGGGGSVRTESMGPPVKRVRVTRRSVAEEEQARQS